MLRGATAKFKFRQYFLRSVWGQTVRFNDRQYFRLYGTYYSTKLHYSKKKIACLVGWLQNKQDMLCELKTKKYHVSGEGVLKIWRVRTGWIRKRCMGYVSSYFGFLCS